MWLDLAIILFVIILGFVGFKRGFLATVLSFAGVLFSFILAIALCKPIANLFVGSAFEASISSKALEMLSNIGGLMTTEIPSYEALVENLSLKLPKVIAESLASSLSSIIGTSADKTVAELLTPGLTKIFITAITFVGIFILSFILIIIVKNIAHVLHNLPIIGTIDKTLGFVLGAIIAFMIISLFFLILSAMTGVEKIQPVFAQIESSIISKYLYNNNLILLIGKKILEAPLVTPTSLPS